MDLFVEALSISLMSLVMAFSVLILIMLAMYASAALLGKREDPAPAAGRAQGALPKEQTAQPAASSDATDQEHVAAIMAALQAAQVDIPSGGRVRIEKVSRGS